MDTEKKRLTLKEIFIKFKRILLFVILISFGYALSEAYHFKNGKDGGKTRIKTLNETSVAINERGEFMLIDRNTGEFVLYQDSIGRSIFELYAATMKSTYERGQ